MKKVKKIVLYAVVVIAVIGIGIVAKSKLTSSKKTATTSVAATKTAVDVQTVTSKEKTLGDTYKATLEAYQQGTVTSKLSAKIASVSVENGQYVNVGDTIATLDDQDVQNNIKTAQASIAVYEKQEQASEQSLNSAQVAMESLKINVDDAQRNYDREKALYDGKVISQSDFQTYEKALNTAKAAYDSGNASIQTAQANIETAKANIESQNVTLEKYQSDLSNTVIKAPISGVISNKSMNIGQMASTSTSLATINDISSVYATIQISQDKINSVKIGQTATITVDGNDAKYNGTVQNIDLSADTTSRVFNVKVKIDNNDKSLLPGIYAQVELASSQTAEIITVPINSLSGNEGDYYIFINNNGTARKTKVTIGETDDNNVEVTSGVQNGDQIICSNTSTLQDGDAVDVVTNQQDNSTKDSASK